LAESGSFVFVPRNDDDRRRVIGIEILMATALRSGRGAKVAEMPIARFLVL
jgi:hypothetical protein